MSKVDELKKKHPGATVVEFEDGVFAAFKKPTRQVVGMAMNTGRTNPLGMVEVIVKNCLLDASEGLDLFSDDAVGYLMGLAEKVDIIIGTKKAEIKN